MPASRRLRTAFRGPSRRPAAPLLLGRLLAVLAPSLLTGCLDAPERTLPGVVCRNLAPGAAADTLTLRVRADPPDDRPARLLVRVDPAGQGPGPDAAPDAPTQRGTDPSPSASGSERFSSHVTAGLALEARHRIFRGCAGATSELLLGVPGRPVEKAWLWIGSDRPVRVVVGGGGREAEADAPSLVVAPGASGTLGWRAP